MDIITKFRGKDVDTLCRYISPKYFVVETGIVAVVPLEDGNSVSVYVHKENGTTGISIRH